MTDTPPLAAAAALPHAHPPSTGRRALLWGAAALAGLAGAGLAWQRYQPKGTAQTAQAALDAFWALSLQTPQGEALRLEPFRGKPLVLNFWATWCPPCVEEMPMLDAFYRANMAKSWQVLGLAVDQPAAVQRFMQHTPVHYPLGMAGVGGVALSKALGNQAGGLPFTVVVQADGLVGHRKIGQLRREDLQLWLQNG